MLELDFKNEIIKSVPPVVVSGVTLFGIELNDWVILLTILYIFIQCVSLVFRIHRDQCIFKIRIRRLCGKDNMRASDKKMPIGHRIHKITDKDIDLPDDECILDKE